MPDPDPPSVKAPDVLVTVDENEEVVTQSSKTSSPKKGGNSFKQGLASQVFDGSRQVRGIFRKGRNTITHESTLTRMNTMPPPGSGRFKVKSFLDSNTFKIPSLFALFIALFGGSLFILFDVPDDPGTVTQDIIMILVTLTFLVELMLRCFSERATYPFSFFFWMDTLGTASMLFEISFCFGTHGKMDNKDENVNTLLLRAARASKVGARAGRFTKVVKVLNFFHRHRPDEIAMSMDEAKVLRHRLMMVLSSKVAILTITLVMGVPLLGIGRFPVDDLSLRAWSRALEQTYAEAYDTLEAQPSLMSDPRFEKAVLEFRDFYDDMWYKPFEIEGYNEGVMINGVQKLIPGQSVISSPRPDRKDFIVRQRVTHCRIDRPDCRDGIKAALFYDFGQSKKFEAGMDIAMVVFIVVVMALEAGDISTTLDRMVVRPVERMLGTVRMMAKVLSLVTDIRQGAQDEALTDDDIDALVSKAKSPVISEAELLENVFAKLAKLTNVFLAASLVDENDMVSMDYESQGVLKEVLQVSNQQEQRLMHAKGEGKMRDGPVVTNLGVSPDDILSWQLNMLELERDLQTQVVTYIFFDSDIGQATAAHFIDAEIFSTFLSAVRTGYHASNPYHNSIHAFDVVCVVYRILTMVRALEWLSDVDVCALLIAALCHDVGHAGKTNPFLIETGHELALRYNDKSPLENMHCARLFEICKESTCNVFKTFDREAYKQARNVCVSTILHTDNALHFDMVKDVKKFYDLTSDICDVEAKNMQSRGSDEAFSETYKTEVLQKEPVMWLKLLLHTADISNPLKPFVINQAWASRVQDEFFLQGDEEKRLGLPVGMLNDRDKVNRAGSEHGFISFLVCPLVFALVGCFPALHPLAGQMASNSQDWRNYWVQQSNPPAEDVKKRDDDIQKIKDKVEELGQRRALATVRTHKTGILKNQINTDS